MTKLVIILPTKTFKEGINGKIIRKINKSNDGSD